MKLAPSHCIVLCCALLHHDSDLRKRVETAEGVLKERVSEGAATQAALTALRDREAGLHGTVLRKEALLRELRERLDSVQQVRKV